MTREFPPFLRELLASVPEPGQGHAWLYKVARQLHAHLPALEIVTLLETSAANHGQRFTHREIVEAVQNSVAAAWQPNGRPRPMQAASKWPCVDQARRTAIIRDGGALARLWEASPVRLADNEAHTEEIIDRLFPGNSLLCCGKSNSVFDTRPREAWRGKLAAMQLLVPSPMSAIEGVTKEGWGFAPDPTRGLCPLGPPLKAEPLESIHFGCGEGGQTAPQPPLRRSP